MAQPDLDTLGDLLTNTTIEVCDRLAIPYKPANVNIVQLDNEIKNLAPSLAKVMWDYFYSYHRFTFYFVAMEQRKPWATNEELIKREGELIVKKSMFYEQLEVFSALSRVKMNGSITGQIRGVS